MKGAVLWYVVTFEDGGKAYIDPEVFERQVTRGVYYPLLNFLDKSLTRRWVSITKID